MLEASGHVYGFEAERYRRDGSRFWTSVHVRVVRDKTGKALYYEGVVEDITTRKKAVDMLRESEEKYRTLFEQAGDYILVFEVSGEKDLIIVDANQAALRVHGYAREELIGMSVKNIDRGLSEDSLQ